MKLRNLFSHKPKVVSPREFSFGDWKEALLATKDAVSGKRLGILAAGIAYFMTLAFFPLVAAVIAISSFVLEPNQIKDLASSIEQFFPKDIAALISTQLTTALNDKSANIIIAVISILIALFSVSGAVQNTISASNAAYDVEENRGFIKQRLVSFEMLLLFMANGALIGLILLMNAPTLVDLGLHPVVVGILSIGRWLILPVILSVTLAVFYRYGPNRPDPKWQWVSWGSTIAAVLWLLITVGFFIYARYFANFSQSYGTFAGIIVLMSWLNLSALVILLGAETNHRLEKQTSSRTTKK